MEPCSFLRNPVNRAVLASLLLGFAAIACAAPARAQTLTATITGHLTDASTGAPLASQTGVVSYSVALHDENGHQRQYDKRTGSDGSYAYTGLAPGTYYLRTINSGGYIDELYPNIMCRAEDCDPVTGTPVTVSAGATAVVDFALDRGGSISVAAILPPGGTGNPKTYLYNAAGSRVTVATAVPSTGPVVFAGLPRGRTSPGSAVPRAPSKPCIRGSSVPNCRTGPLAVR